MSAISDSTRSRCSDKIELDLGFGQQLLDPAGELRLEGGARHLGGRGDIHVLEHERLDLRLRRVDHARGAGRGGSRVSSASGAAGSAAPGSAR